MNPIVKDQLFSFHRLNHPLACQAVVEVLVHFYHYLSKLLRFFYIRL